MGIPETREETLQRVINTAVSGDTIFICQAAIGISRNIIVQAGKSLVAAEGKEPTLFVNSEGRGALLHLYGNDITIKNIIVDGKHTRNRGIEVYAGFKDIEIIGSEIKNIDGQGLSSIDSAAHAIRIQPKTSNVVIKDNIIKHIGGQDTSALSQKNYVGSGKIAHRAIYAIEPYGIDINNNNISNVYGFWDADAIDITADIAESCNTPLVNKVRNNTITQFGKRGIKVRGNNINVYNNVISSTGTRTDANIAYWSVGAGANGIATYPNTHCYDKGIVVRNNTLNLSKADSAIYITSAGEYTNNTVNFSSQSFGRNGMNSFPIVFFVNSTPKYSYYSNFVQSSVVIRENTLNGYNGRKFCYGDNSNLSSCVSYPNIGYMDVVLN